ncbi:MAG: KEOPS complex subunit Pcc1 [Halobacteria archaeon]|nr:KEOPS complex subunit Pcc1 [Halobacteria archaeon]
MAEIEFETEHGDPESVARSVSPDNTDDIRTRVEGGKVVTRIERDDIGSLQTTADDYMKNLMVAEKALTVGFGSG